MSDINNYYNGASLSEAAYSNFSNALIVGLSSNDKKTATKDALKAQDFTKSQAEAFVSKYEVLSQYSNSTTGFSAK